MINIETIQWIGGLDGCVDMIDQTLLPNEYRRIAVRDVETLWQAIKTLQVRGAPAIGIAAAYGVILGLQNTPPAATVEQMQNQVRKTCTYLASSRPTAVNLFWALDRMKQTAQQCQATSPGEWKARLLAEAHAIRDEDAAMCRAIGKNGAGLIQDGISVLTHCNAGGLATADYGTALAVMFTAQEQGKKFHVYADETRPLLQGARLTAWELMQRGIAVTLICDNMAGHLMSLGKVNLIITGADRIAANGDTANKIGTYSLAVLAQAHNIPFYIAAPSSTFDLSLPDGKSIPIEQRAAEEITQPWGHRIAPAAVCVYNPAFDVTPREYITAIITERGLIHHPDTKSISEILTAK